MLLFLVKPHIIKVEPVRQLEGKDVTLVCESEGQPAPKLTFKKAGAQHPYVDGENENVTRFFFSMNSSSVFSTYEL